MTPAALRACAEDIDMIRELLSTIDGHHQFPGTIGRIYGRLTRLRERLAAKTPVENTRIPVAGYQDGYGNSVVTQWCEVPNAVCGAAPCDQPAKCISEGECHYTKSPLARTTRQEAPDENALVADFVDWIVNKGLVFAQFDDMGRCIPINEQDGERIALDYLAAIASAKATP